MPNPDSSVLVDGSVNFSGGVDSLPPTTLASQSNPNGLKREQLAWLINATVRDGGISPRWGWQPLGKIQNGTAFYQGGFLYEPLGDNPYLICSIGGRIYKVVPSAAPTQSIPGAVLVTDLSAAFGLTNPANIEHAYFAQGEEFLVIQAGDGVTLPLFWDGNTLRRSVGLKAQSTVTVVISTDTLTWLAPVTGQTVDITFGSVAGLAVGDNVTIFKHATNINRGTYQITVISGNKLTLLRLDANTAPQHFGPNSFDLTTQQTTYSSELPAAYAMDYYMQRIWYTLPDLKSVTAGDIVGDTNSGTTQYNFRDSILKVTENPLAIGGDGFSIPSNGGNIRALTHPIVLNAVFGQGQLFICTRKQVYALQVPVSRADWISANAANGPLMTVIQINNGSVNDRSIAKVNGDIYYQSLEPSVRSLVSAVRYFDEPGNTAISNQENRILQFVDRSLMAFSSGIEFDNRCLQATLPKRLSQGIVNQAILPLDFTPISEFGSGLKPVWEGHYEGLDVLQLFTGDYGGLQRAFAPIVSRADGTIQLWELTQGGLFENGDSRIFWQVETPAYTFGTEFELKRIVSGELWIDRLFGTAEITVEYRTDGETCYIPWLQFKECSARNCNETVPPSCLPSSYPAPSLGYGYRNSITLPKPPVVCDTQMGRPSDIGHQFQLRITVHGSCRIRGIYVHATKVERRLYKDMRPSG